ncbi:MAG: hypothetical protein ACLP00_28795, partial [Terracidiphilus sp.]
MTITEIISIMEIMDGAVMSESQTASAALLEPTGIHTLDVRHAMDKLIAAVSPEQSHANVLAIAVFFGGAVINLQPSLRSSDRRCPGAHACAV